MGVQILLAFVATEQTSACSRARVGRVWTGGLCKMFWALTSECREEPQEQHPPTPILLLHLWQQSLSGRLSQPEVTLAKDRPTWPQRRILSPDIPLYMPFSGACTCRLQSKESRQKQAGQRSSLHSFFKFIYGQLLFILYGHVHDESYNAGQWVILQEISSHLAGNDEEKEHVGEDMREGLVQEPRSEPAVRLRAH